MCHRMMKGEHTEKTDQLGFIYICKAYLIMVMLYTIEHKEDLLRIDTSGGGVNFGALFH